jgi:uncharacterized protein
MALRKPLNTVVVKTVGSRCNLNCDYCFYLNKELNYADEKLMSDDTLEVFIRQMMEQSGNSFGIVWQGGEPSMAGAGFFRKAISFMQQYGEGKNKTISNLLQTNGYFLNNELLDVMSEYSFLTGLSLDGPQEIHDTYRKTSNGKGSWNEVMKSWEKLNSKNIACNILCCVTKESAIHAEKIYQFFKQHQMLWLQFIPVSESKSDGNFADFSVSPEKWGAFMCSIFDLWYSDFITNNQPPSIRFIENAFHTHLGLNPPECTYQKTCGDYLVLEHNGDVFSCDYLVNANTRLGNIHSNNLKEMLNGIQQLAFGEAKLKLHSDCKNCKFLFHCNGGCPKYRNLKTQKYNFCESYKMFLNYSESRLILISKEFKKNNPNIGKEVMDLSGFF